MLDLEKISQEMTMCKSDLVTNWILPIVEIEEMIDLVKRQELEIHEQVALNAAQIRVIDSFSAQPVAAQQHAQAALSDDEQAQAWIAVTDALDKGVPGWLGGTLSGLDSAVRAISELCAARPTITDLAIVVAANAHLTTTDYIWTADVDQLCVFARTILASQQPAAAPAAPSCFLCHDTGRYQFSTAVPAGVDQSAPMMAECQQCKAPAIQVQEGAAPNGWRDALQRLRDNTETFGPYSQETARVAIECCMDAIDELAAAPAPVQPAAQQGDGELRKAVQEMVRLLEAKDWPVSIISTDVDAQALEVEIACLVAQRAGSGEDVIGMAVSIDVSTCEDDAGRRYFGKVDAVQECPGEKKGLILLVQEAKPNFKQLECERAGSNEIVAYVHTCPNGTKKLIGTSPVLHIDPHFPDEFKGWTKRPLVYGDSAHPDSERDAARYRKARQGAYRLAVGNPTPEEFDAAVDSFAIAAQQGESAVKP